MTLILLALLCDLAGIALMGGLLVQEYRPRFVETAGRRRPISHAGYSGQPLYASWAHRPAQSLVVRGCPCTW